MNTPEEPTPDEDNYVYEDDEELVPLPTEGESRSKNDWTVIAEPFGIGIAPIATSGLAFGYSINENSLIEASYVWGGDSVKDVIYETELTSIRLKYFFLSSAYLNLGSAYRNVRGTFSSDSAEDEEINDSEKSSLTSSTSLFTAEVAIGNKWQMDHFVMGCDWLGFNLPVSSPVKRGFDTKEATGDGGSFDTYNRISLGTTKQFLRIYFGANF